MTLSNQERARELLRSQEKAIALHSEILLQGLVRPGITEQQLAGEITELARRMFGVTRQWHRPVIRSGPNTLLTYVDADTDRTLTDDDIAFFDLGPLFGEWEADFARTVVLGTDPAKVKLLADLDIGFRRGRALYEADADLRAGDLYRGMQQIARDLGWELGGRMSGHTVGEVHHVDDPITTLIDGSSDRPLRALAPDGRVVHWILEIHLVDRERGIGGFLEQLLTIGPDETGLLHAGDPDDAPGGGPA